MSAAIAYPRWYTFALDEATEVTITLEVEADSAADTHLRLREGDDVRSGEPGHYNDDYPELGDAGRSRITANLASFIPSRVTAAEAPRPTDE